MNTECTPGPWHVLINSRKDRILVEIVTLDAIEKPEWLVATVNHCVIDISKDISDTVAANARLISAAPDMLEALEAWKAFWDDMPKGQLGKICCDIGLLNEAFCKMSQSMLKAKGKAKAKGKR